MFKPLVIDGHCDSIGDFIREKRTLRVGTEGGHWDIERARAGGMALQIMACFIESEFKPHSSSRRGLELIQAAQRFIAENYDRVLWIRNQQDLSQLPNSDKLGILLSVEGGEILGESLFMLDIIYELGVRALGLTWNQRNALADGVGEQTNSRLTLLGQNVIRRMNELGMLIDVSHLNEEGFYHVLELTDVPIVASHSCAHALCPHPRNLTDDQLKALAHNHGLVGINFYSRFLTEQGEASIVHVVQHIAHIAEVAGVETIGLGSDFDGIEQAPRGLEDASKYPNLAEALLQAGFHEGEIDQIFNKNFRRLLGDVIK
ncbi:dipeptidase [Desulfitobacterium metallireducens]|uniref:Peptidase n=1 Tax=Desulfitobacterium metallireducens DSM 15288 TaxID=871968 RepID=W0E702_9FIRM|nr:dipeptidase [Desulfitobacterium metallireducens]AHF06655.1 peptidase [Desulfitobacterium metallireducens DSM 15288]